MYLGYIHFLMNCQLKPNPIHLARFNQNSSHDQWNRFLSDSHPNQKRLERVTCPKKLRRGMLLIDDTVIKIPFGRMSEGASWVYSSTEKKIVYGDQVVMLVWTNGKKREIIDFKIYKKHEKTKIELALELLSDARNTLQLHPDWVIFDSWYSSAELLMRINDYGWFFMTRFRKNRVLDGKKLEFYQNELYWGLVGQIRGGLTVFMIKNGSHSYASNRLRATRSQILEVYKFRQNIEEVFKQLSFLGFKTCQSRSIKAKENHFWMVVLTFSVLERKRRHSGCSVYELRKKLILGEEVISEAYLERLLKVA